MSKKAIKSLSLRKKMIIIFCLPTILLFMVNMTLYLGTSRMLASLNEVYASNNSLNQMSQSLDELHTATTGYLSTKTSDALEAYYIAEQDYRDNVDLLEDNTDDNDNRVLERNIKKLSGSYVMYTNQAVESKRGGNVEKYKTYYDKATRLYNYIEANITSLNNQQFVNNSKSYSTMMSALQTIEELNIFTLVLIGLANLSFVVLIASTITEPLIKLSSAANRVSNGDFDVSLPAVKNNDEIGVVTMAFNKMVVSLKEYINKLTESMEIERKLKENELIMANHIKDAELKYLQSQINPHFLFNTLNAGAQLAMMEGADRTSEYMHNVANFFRYNIKKNKDVVTLKEEIELVDIYIYIINVRFAGEIQFVKNVDESLLNVQIPSMILQPIVENSINYGVRNIEWAKKISLSVYELGDYICVSIKDNGIGMTSETITKILEGSFEGNPQKADSNGVGLANCIERLNIFYERDDVLDMISEGINKGTETILYLTK
ncbi:Histidine kinase-, DNA gyrase B-, and HSP90-like ATPase [Pseudobutyrivibrio sp. YE44]|uniref:sensor histidine kinase n=1 Tax=Pseudobutyrivibrio sp. YE44 TaxID=1520802 RepID=UPI00088A5667|nr:histidine kinase [Pseudobutyrivibrio sp. YE44]SDB22991.1 Histidine kinase-, DNA gyrase B-, and HSP90-like ATPase [Pseudobutyrivibrio sp. YE44]